MQPFRKQIISSKLDDVAVECPDNFPSASELRAASEFKVTRIRTFSQESLCTLSITFIWNNHLFAHGLLFPLTDCHKSIIRQSWGLVEQQDDWTRVAPLIICVVAPEPILPDTRVCTSYVLKVSLHISCIHTARRNTYTCMSCPFLSSSS